MPVVVFSDSATPNWKAPDCKGDPKPAVSDDEAKILSIIDTEAWKVEAAYENEMRINENFCCLVY